MPGHGEFCSYFAPKRPEWRARRRRAAVDGAVRRLALRHVPETRDTESAPGLDVAGTAVGAVGLGALTYGLTGLGGANEKGGDGGEFF